MIYGPKDKYNYNYKHINDPIYGSIGLSKLEIDLINTKEFQRLRNLKQLSVANYVFPCGDHSRFSHSLGVLFVMGKMCMHLETIAPSDFGNDHTTRMRVAALLHDIGHYPLSHLGERVYGHFIETSNLEAQESFLSDNSENIDYYSMHYLCKSESKADHERLGQAIIQLSQNITCILIAASIDPDEVAAIIKGESKNLVYSNLLHSACDADRIDYLIRDSFQTGVKFGMVDLDYLINMMRIEEYTIPYYENSQVEKIIAYDSKGQHVLEHFLMCRYFHYLQVVHNKTIGKFESIVAYLFSHMLKDKKFYITGDEIKRLFDTKTSNDERKVIYEHINWERFNDYTLMSTLFDYCSNSDDSTIKALYSCLVTRTPPATIYSKRELIQKEKSPSEAWQKANACIESKLNLIASELKIDKNLIGYKNTKTIIHAIPEYKSIYNEKEVEDKYREAVKIINPDTKEITLLVQDENSIIRVTSDYVAHSLNVFLALDNSFENREETIRSFQKQFQSYL